MVVPHGKVHAPTARLPTVSLGVFIRDVGPILALFIRAVSRYRRAPGRRYIRRIRMLRFLLLVPVDLRVDAFLLRKRALVIKEASGVHGHAKLI